MAQRRALGSRLLSWCLFLVLQLALTASAWHWEPEPNASWNVLGAGSVELRSIGDYTFAVARQTVLAGDVLASTNVGSLEECAANCAQLEECSIFNYCHEDGCPMELGLPPEPAGFCELRYQEATGHRLGVFKQASGGPPLGDAGIKIVVTAPQAPDGYRLFPAQGLVNEYDLVCQESEVQNQCMIRGSLEELLARCDAWPACQAVVYRPLGRANVTQPFGVLKGSRDGEPLDPSRGNLNPAAFTLVKVGQLAEAAGQAAGAGAELEGRSGLAAGAIAGIAVGIAAGFAAVCLAALLAWRRHQQRCRQSASNEEKGLEQELSTASSRMKAGGAEGAAAADLERGSGPGGSGGLRHLVVRRSTEGQEPGIGVPATAPPPTPPGTPSGSPTRSLVIRLFGAAPNPQWLDLVVPRSQIEFCSHANGQLVRLGGGASGSVYRVILNSHTLCACKVFDFQQRNSLPQHFIEEATLLRQFRHPNIIQFFGISVAEGQGLLLMELMGGRDLGHCIHSLVRGSRGGRLYGWYNRGHRTALQIASGLAYLHSKSLVHLDLKPPNILLSRDGAVKIGDVGFSRIMRGNQISSLPEGRIGTWNYCAPEILLGERACEKADIYSFGVILAEMITGEEPRRGQLPTLLAPAQCPAEVVTLQARCMALDPSQRPSAAEIVDLLRALPAAPPTPPASPQPRAAPAVLPAHIRRQGLPAIFQPQVGPGGLLAGADAAGPMPLPPPLRLSSGKLGEPQSPRLVTGEGSIGSSIEGLFSSPEQPGSSTAGAAGAAWLGPPAVQSEEPMPCSPFQLASQAPLPSPFAAVGPPADPASPRAVWPAPEAAARPAAAGLGEGGEPTLRPTAFGSMQLAGPVGSGGGIEQLPEQPPSPQQQRQQQQPLTPPPTPPKHIPASGAGALPHRPRLQPSHSAPALPVAASCLVGCGGSMPQPGGGLPALSSEQERGSPVYCSALAYMLNW